VTPKPALDSVQRMDEVSNKQADLSEEEFRYERMSQEWRDELLEASGWHTLLETFAGTMRLAVALTDRDGQLLGQCHNPQPSWQMARGAMPQADHDCLFCLAPSGFCNAVSDALKTGKTVIVEDMAGLAHVAVPLSLGGQQLGTLIAGQVFSRYPQPLLLERVARDMGISPQMFWQTAIRQMPVTRTTLQLYGDLLMSLGHAFLGERYAAILHRKLSQTNERYRLLIDGAKGYALHTLNTAGRVTSWNSGAERMFGYSEVEIIGKNGRVLIPEDADRNVLQKAMVEADRSGWAEFESWQMHKDGTRFLGAGVLASMGADGAREYGKLVHDVTDLRRSEQDLQQAQRLESVGVLAGGIAHDFNNLLTGIIMSLSLIKTGLPPDDPSCPIVEIAERSAWRAAELVAQLLAHAGKGKFVITRFDLSILISEMLPLIAASIPKSVELKLSLAPGLCWIEADASQIRQIVMNLIINGAEAIGVEHGIVQVRTGISKSRDDVFMEVKDSGSGMDEATKSKMFDPFFTTKLTGRGLGLAAVSGIVRAHNGTMRVDSVQGQGTTFMISFPAVQASVPSALDPPAVVVPHDRQTILIVDDEPAVRKITEAVLEKSGYSVLVAKDGREAVEIFRQNASQIAAVLLDITMPVMGGREAFRLIREIEPGVPIIMSSGYTEVFALEQFGSDLDASFIQKPYTAGELLAAIQTAGANDAGPE
jgi:PAS domain S-box-containing protein